MKYTVKKTKDTFRPDGRWGRNFWKKAETLTIAEFMGERPEHFPKAQAKLLYDDDFIYVIFRVEDNYIRAVARKYKDAVWCDSCVEFFFTPGTGINEGYFNLETNCGGIMLMCHQTAREKNRVLVAESDAAGIKRFHSLPQVIEDEIAVPTVWTLEYALPMDIVEKYTPVIRPVSGVTWRANFYKCADDCSHPHWLTWSKVELPQPDFHQPNFFGTLEFNSFIDTNTLQAESGL